MCGLSTEARTACCIVLSHGSIVLVAVAAVLTVGMVGFAVHDVVAWETVALPPFIAAAVLWVFFTYTSVAWVVRCRTVMEEPCEKEDGVDFSLDMVLTVFKFTLAIQVYLGIVVLAVVLWWLHERGQVSMAVVCAPVAVLAIGHLFVGILFKQPEVEPRGHLLVGGTLLAHAAALICKFDVPLCQAWLWSVVFAPSWCTYALVAAFFSSPPKQFLDFGRALEIVRRVGWLTGFALLLLAQVCLTLRLDDVWAAPWALVLLPVVAAIIIFASVCGHEVALRVQRILLVVMDAATVKWEDHPSYATFDPPDSVASGRLTEPTWPLPPARSYSASGSEKDALILPPPAAA